MPSESGRAVIGRDLIIHGEIRNGGEVEVLGGVIGSIAAEHVVIQPGGHVTGRLDVGSAAVHGHLEGRIRVRNLISIGASGAVHGDVRYGQLALEAGGDLAAEVRNLPPELGGDFEVVVRRGRTVRITTADLIATDAEDGADALTYHVSNAEHGFVARSEAPALAVETFTQAEIAAGKVMFVHDADGSDRAGFDVLVADSQGAASGTPRRVTVVVMAAE
ncbi:MAG: polymer-forming cytoskeletal protein [Hyphomicrobiaceae bacterium]